MLPTVRTTAELYPPPANKEWWDFLHAIATSDLDASGHFVLRRSLNAGERKALQDRAAVLAPWLAPGKHHDAGKSVNQMMLAFGKSADVAGAKASVTAYVTALAPLPWWAIERACKKFSDGLVRPEEVGAKALDRSFPPTSAQVAMVARDLVKPFGEEATRVRMIIRGSPPEPAMTPAQRAASGERISAMLRETLHGSDEAVLIGAEEDARRACVLSRIARKAQEDIRGEYAALGVDPPEPLVSFSLMRKMGWRIEDVEGNRRLVGPSSGARARTAR